MVWKKVSKQSNSVNSPKLDENKGVLGSLDFKNPMIYDVKGSQLIRKSDSGEYFDSDFRDTSTFNPIRLKAYQELNPSNLDKSHPNINFIYSISETRNVFTIPLSATGIAARLIIISPFFT